MRYRSDQKATTRARILEAAGQTLRRRGMSASVGDTMRVAGLTVGGFYAHFKSKESLCIEAIGRTLQASRARWLQEMEGVSEREWLARFARRYLNARNRDDADDCCPLPALISDVARASKPTRAALAAELEATLGILQSHHRGTRGQSAREEALTTLALCVGALALGKAVRGLRLSDEVMAAAAKRVAGRSR